MHRRVVITGLGVFSPLGIGTDAYWEALANGTSGVGVLTRFDAGEFPIKAAAEVPPFNPRDYILKSHRKSLKVMSRDVKLGVVAAMNAIDHAGIITEQKRVDPARLGVSFGAGYIASDVDEMGLAFFESTQDDANVDYRAFGAESMKSFFPLWLLKYLPNMPACHVSIFRDAQGPNNSITSGDAASTQAIGEACRVIQRGAADVMISGGVDGKVNPISYGRYWLLGGLCTREGKPEELSRPFEKSRSGFVVGEGAGALILEELEHARARGAEIYGEITGYGAGCDAYAVDKVHPDGRGRRTALRNALRDAGLAPDDVDAVFANANSSVEGDRAESRALRATFANVAEGPPVTSTRSMVGYISAAAGALDAVAAVGALRSGVIPPTINYDEPDPECPVNVVGNVAREAKLNHVVVNSGGFGGQFAALVISRFVA